MPDLVAGNYEHLYNSGVIVRDAGVSSIERPVEAEIVSTE